MIFISYRISDSLDLVGRLDADLTRVFGSSAVFRDKTRLQGGHDWTEVLERNACVCRVMLVVIGETWQSVAFPDGDWKGVPRLWHPDDWVRKEITLALDSERVIIPVFLNSAVLPSEGWLLRCSLERLHRKQGVPLRSADYEADLKQLIAVLRMHYPELPSYQLHEHPLELLRLEGTMAQHEGTNADPQAAVVESSPSLQLFSPALPQWRESIGSIEIAIPRAYRERVISLSDLSILKMRDIGFSTEAIKAFHVSFGEATENAFEHGCTTDDNLVTLRIEMSREYASFSVINPRGRTFDLEQLLQDAPLRLSQDPRSRRGRGLLLIRHLADQLTSVENHLGIKAVFERDDVVFSVSHVEDVAVATLRSGIRNRSFQRRTIALVEAEAERNVLLDFSRWETGGTAIYTIILDAEAILSHSKKRVVALLYPNKGRYFSPIELPDELVAYDVPTAVTKLGRSELQRKISNIITAANQKTQ
jgi:anti-sigma regulatory factor (Ser/Thr protein kinase)